MADYYRAEIHIGSGEITEEQFQAILKVAKIDGMSLGAMNSYDESLVDEEAVRSYVECEGALVFWDGQAAYGRFRSIEGVLKEFKIPFIVNSDGNTSYGPSAVFYDGQKEWENSTSEEFESTVSSSVIDEALEMIQAAQDARDFEEIGEFLTKHKKNVLDLKAVYISGAGSELTR